MRWHLPRKHGDVSHAPWCRYGWHFPELAKVINDNFQYAKVVMLAKDKSNITEELKDGLTEITGDEDVSEQVPPSRCSCVFASDRITRSLQ